MFQDSEKIFIGHKIKNLRNKLGLTQSAMANEIEISSSYLNLLEANQRPVTVKLLFKLGQKYNIDLKEFSDDDTGKIIVELNEVFSDPTFNKNKVSKKELKNLSEISPSIIQSILDLYSNYSKLREVIQNNNINNQLDLKENPLLKVRKFLENSQNHFPQLEFEAENFRSKAKIDNINIFYNLLNFLEKKHQIQVKIIPQNVIGKFLRQNDLHRKRLLLSEGLWESQRIFQICFQIALIEYEELIDDLIEKSNFKDKESIDILKISLAGYFAGAVMMPYENFLETANESRHDIDILCRRFSSSFEQVCHRLTTLNNKNNRGVPFFFLKVDEAGHISKRLSGAGIQFANNGGRCAKWIPHQAFRTPGKILSQYSELEEGQQFFTIAKTVSVPRSQTYINENPLFSVALGCEKRHTSNIMYADGIDARKPSVIVPIGLSCRTCEREFCQHRGEPPIGRSIKFDPNSKSIGHFEFNE